jgi:hypothetical protein
MMEAVRTSETSVDNHFTRQYNPEDCSEHQLKEVQTGSESAKRNVEMFALFLAFLNIRID